MLILLLVGLYVFPGLIAAFFLGQFQYMILRYVEDPVIRKIMSVPLPVITGGICLWAAIRMGEPPWREYELLAAFFTKWGMAAVLAGYGLVGIFVGGWRGQRERKKKR